jgi:hypothetical protein
MPHDPQARREAGAKPLVLFGDYGRTVEGYRPADEDLAHAAPASSDGCRRHVAGPHLRIIRTRDHRSKTGVVGISMSRRQRDGRHFYIVNLGSTSRRFCIETLGRTEAWRRATLLRREHVKKVFAANAAILAARAKGGAA